ncbi:OsmC/Ohr family protein [Pleurotus pulmonarius]
MLRTSARSILSTISRSPRNVRSLTSGPLKLKDTKYTAVGVASGAGRNGQTECNGENPEQLFAMGYSACFLGALQAVAARAGQKDKITNAVVNAKVHLGEPEGLGGFGIGVELEVSGAPKDLVDAAHEFCPYSRSLKYGVDVTAKVV